MMLSRVFSGRALLGAGLAVVLTAAQAQAFRLTFEAHSASNFTNKFPFFTCYFIDRQPAISSVRHQ